MPYGKHLPYTDITCLCVPSSIRLAAIQAESKYKYESVEEDDNTASFYSLSLNNDQTTKELEETLEKYILIARKLHYGLTSDIIKRLSYDLAVKNNLKVPKSWQENKKAGKHWLYGYLRRHPLIYEILSWSRKFRPPITRQYNTTVEPAQKAISAESNDTSAEELETEEIDKDAGESQPVIIIPIKKNKNS